MANEFRLYGFNHVTAAGAVAYWQMMSSVGTIGMLWDVPNDLRVDTLMQKEDFCMTAYITAKGVKINTPEFDDMMVALHEELVDARFALEHAYTQNLNAIDCPVGKRGFIGLQSIEESHVFESTTWYPMVKMSFTNLRDLEQWCAEKTANGTVKVTVVTRGEEGVLWWQKLQFNINVADEYHAMVGVVEVLKRAGYTEFTYNVR